VQEPLMQGTPFNHVHVKFKCNVLEW